MKKYSKIFVELCVTILIGVSLVCFLNPVKIFASTSEFVFKRYTQMALMIVNSLNNEIEKNPDKQDKIALFLENQLADNNECFTHNIVLDCSAKNEYVNNSIKVQKLNSSSKNEIKTTKQYLDDKKCWIYNFQMPLKYKGSICGVVNLGVEESSMLNVLYVLIFLQISAFVIALVIFISLMLTILKNIVNLKRNNA